MLHRWTILPFAIWSARRRTLGWITFCVLQSACAAGGPDPAPSVAVTSVLAEAGAEPREASDNTADAALAEPERKRGLLGFLRRDKGSAEIAPDVSGSVPNPAGEPDPAETTQPKRSPSDTSGTAGFPNAETQASVDTSETSPDPDRQPRLFGFLSNRGRDETLNNPDPSGAFGPGVLLPFGKVVKACGLSKREMGTEVARSQGSGTFRLYDTAPSSTAPRAQFLTGFKDRCARQFTASLALFGSAEVHEATRYNTLNKNPYSSTDDAYERIKTRVCGVRRGAFCPENRIDKLSRDTAFVSVYRTFGGTDAWLELFLHKGELVAHQTLVP